MEPSKIIKNNSFQNPPISFQKNLDIRVGSLSERHFPLVPLDRRIQLLSCRVQMLQGSLKERIPSEIALEQKQLSNELSNLLSEAFSQKDQKILKKIRRSLEKIAFELEFPLVVDLREFVCEILKIRRKILNSGLVGGLEELHPVQHQEIFQEAGVGASSEGIAYGMRRYVKNLQVQAKVAELFFLGHFQKGMKGFLSLPMGIRLQVQEILWEVFGPLQLDWTQEGGKIAEALLLSLECRMGMHD